MGFSQNNKSLSLASKGLILVSIPTVVLFVFGGLILHLEQEAEAEARIAVRSRNVSNLIKLINKITNEILQIIDLYNSSHSKQWEESGFHGYLKIPFRKLVRQVRQQYEELDRLTIDRPLLNAAVKRSYKTVYDADAILSKITEGIQQGKKEDVLKAVRKADALGILASDYVSQELLIEAKSEEEFASQSTERQAKIRHEILNWALLVILINAIFGLFLAKFLVNTITNRLGIMSDNAARLAANQPLHSPLPGTDEIAKLDHTLHDMAVALDEAAQQKQRLYNMVTHDIRTPLTAIQGCLELLDGEKDSGQNEQSTRLVKVAVRNCARTMNLINDLLDSQKIQLGMMTLDTSDEALADIFEEVRLTVEDWIQQHGIQIKVGTTDLIIKANRDLVTRIIFNLVSNAIKYSPKGSTITIAAEKSADMATISIADQGKGIEKKFLSTVFEPFRQVDGESSKGGSGLGLAICRDFVQLHGGTIWAQSEPGESSTFSFTIPLAEHK